MKLIWPGDLYLQAVDPARQKGQQLMDAGRVYFASGSRLDFTKLGTQTVVEQGLACRASTVVLALRSMSFYDFDECCKRAFRHVQTIILGHANWALTG